MKVRINRSQLTYFRTKARKNKNEIFAMLFGKRSGKSSVTVKELMYPKMALSTPFECAPDLDDCLEYEADARRRGLISVGTIHSHPGAPAYMSPTDLTSSLHANEIVSGIVEIVGGRTRVTFWRNDTPVPCELEYF